MPTGNGLDEGSTLGPLQDQMQWNVVNRLVEDAKQRGARVVWANGVDAGLGASVWSTDRDKAKEIAARLEAGTVWINGHGGIHPDDPVRRREAPGLRPGVRRRGLKSVSVPPVISG